MESQQAQKVPGMKFRGRDVYLEQKGYSKSEVDADLESVKKDCLMFAVTIKNIQENNGRRNGLILQPPFN